MTSLLCLASALSIGAGAVLLYLASPHQQLLSARRNRRVLAASGAGALLLGLVLTLRIAGPATAVFIWITGAMLVWSVLPLGIAWWRMGAASR